MPFFSVIIPTYNRENFISATINSVLEQSFSDFEILIIDDGSTDNTFTLVDKIANGEPKIKYFKIKNSERGAARNFGIENANGEFLVFLDSDDFFKKDHLKHLYHLIQNNPKINFFASKYDFIENGVVSHAPIFNLSESIIDYKTLLRGNPFACNICVRRKNMNLIKFPEDRKYSGMEDWIFIFSNLWSQDLFLS
ncbi:MAG: glycosyltransferase family 2 protein, partial [Bacteroidota bacterium]